MEKITTLTGFGIVIVDRGWVYVGNISHDGEWCVITNAWNIRKWGTSKGLGEIAINGPTDATELDDYGVVRIPKHALISLLDADKEKWSE